MRFIPNQKITHWINSKGHNFLLGDNPEYRNQFLPGDIKQALIGVLVWAMVSCLAVAQDYLILGESMLFYWLAILRVGYIGLALVMAWLLAFHVKEYRVLDRLVLGWAIASILAVIVTYEFLPNLDEGRFIVNLVVMISLYAFIPKNLFNRLIPALLFTTYDLYFLLHHLSQYTTQTVLAVAFGYSVVSIGAVFYSLFIYAAHRAQYQERKEEKVFQQELQRLATTDSLTNAYNRRKLLDYALDAWYSFKRYRRPFSIIMMDLDGFKVVNDTFGHLHGDQVLVEFATLLMREKRKSDLLGRMGGDEFCLLLPETGEYEAVYFAERILSLCEELSINHNPALTTRVTVSIGIGEAQREDEMLENVFSRADTALYESKNDGKNCLHVGAEQLTPVGVIVMSPENAIY